MLNKDNRVNYISKETKIGARNLNNIQDSILDNSEKIEDLNREVKSIRSQLEQKANLNIYGYSKIRKKLITPTNFTWKDYPINIYKSMSGEITHDLDISKYEYTGGGIYYVDPVNGKSQFHFVIGQQF